MSSISLSTYHSDSTWGVVQLAITQPHTQVGWLPRGMGDNAVGAELKTLAFLPSHRTGQLVRVVGMEKVVVSAYLGQVRFCVCSSHTCVSRNIQTAVQGCMRHVHNPGTLSHAARSACMAYIQSSTCNGCNGCTTVCVFACDPQDALSPVGLRLGEWYFVGLQTFTVVWPSRLRPASPLHHLQNLHHAPAGALLQLCDDTCTAAFAQAAAAVLPAL